MKKKIIVVLTLSILAAVTLVGCGAKKSKDSDKKTTDPTTKENEVTSSNKESKEDSTTANETKAEVTTKENETTTAAETKPVLEKTEFTDDELIKMALDYYEKQNNYRPGVAAIDHVSSDGLVTIHLYDDMGDHTATSAWYEVDRKTAVGKDTMLNTEVDLNK